MSRHHGWALALHSRRVRLQGGDLRARSRRCVLVIGVAQEAAHRRFPEDVPAHRMKSTSQFDNIGQPASGDRIDPDHHPQPIAHRIDARRDRPVDHSRELRGRAGLRLALNGCLLRGCGSGERKRRNRKNCRLSLRPILLIVAPIAPHHVGARYLVRRPPT